MPIDAPNHNDLNRFAAAAKRKEANLGYTIDNRSDFPVIKVSKQRIIRLKKEIRIVRICISEDCAQELEWWLMSVDSFNYREVRPELIDVQIEVDASSSCWGAVLNGLEAKGDMNSRLSGQSSNHRESLANLMALETFQPNRGFKPFRT